MNTVYENPAYYEIAFSFRDIPAEVDVFERCIQVYAKRPVKRILELGCGNSPHLGEIIKRGYAYTGLDSSEAMLAYSVQKAATLDGSAAFLLADMNRFTVPKPFDFAFIALGSLSARNTAEVFSHFQSVGRALHPGGLYFLDWCIRFAPLSDQEDSWTMEQQGIRVTTHFSEKIIDVVGQRVEETLSMEVQEAGTIKTFTETSTHRVIFPQEFLQILRTLPEFEFVGWWNQWDLEQPLDNIQDPKEINRPITLLRKL